MPNSQAMLRERRLPADSFPGGRVVLATKLSSRMRGLLFSPASNDVLVMLPCHDIHTFGMRYAIDIAFVDEDGTVVRAVRDVVPNKRFREPRAVAVLERCAIPREGWFEEGDRIALGQYRHAAIAGKHAAPCSAENRLTN